MTGFPLEVMQLEPMASGHMSLRLTRAVAWEAFDSYAERLLSELGGRVLEKADSPVERVWTTLIDGQRFWLALDDFGLGVSLDPIDGEAAARMADIRTRLLRLRVTDGDAR